MKDQLSWKVGGQQGEGIESTGEIFAVALKRMGYHLYGYRHFSSRIKGGHTNNKIRVSTKPIRAIADDLDVLVAFDQETIDLNIHELAEHGVVMADSKFNPQLPEGAKGTLYSIPFTKIADELGSSLMKNMVAVGASAAALGIDIKAFHAVARETFARKGDKVIEMNIQALNKGYEVFQELAGGQLENLRLKPGDGKKRMFMIGNDAIALGAIAAGCRIMSAYPITPASEIMEYLIKKLPELGGTVVQTEDEIAAITMAIGANFGGARAFTASAGPGLSLMAEGIGLAGMTETPVVIVDTQRGGPSTGLPTKQEQSDINALIYGTHGEIPKVVIAPSTVEEAFYDTVEAFNIAEEFQCPVIIATDLQLSLGKQTADPFDYSRVEIRRGKLVKELEEREEKLFKRFQFSEDGISPRIIPGIRNGLVHATGNEHGENGRPTEDPKVRKMQMEKRLRKLKHFKFYKPLTIDAKHEEPDVLVLGMGSNLGAIQEAKERLESQGHKVNHIHVRLLHPFPSDELRPYLEKAKQILVVENNATGQLANLVRLNVGYADKMRQLNKYDGNPFLPHEIENGLKELLQHGHIQSVSQ